jgi:hypothetical protein
MDTSSVQARCTAVWNRLPIVFLTLMEYDRVWFAVDDVAIL